MAASASRSVLFLALFGPCLAEVPGAECGNDPEGCAALHEPCEPASEVVLLQRSLAMESLASAARARDDVCSELQCSTGLSTSCSNGCCTVTCGGVTQCSNLWCPSGISSSCSNGDCEVKCKGPGGGGALPTPSGTCDRYQCPTGVSSSCSNGLCTLSCGGVPFCTDLYCPEGISTSCSNGDCAIDCRGGSPCGQPCAAGGSCAVYSDPHVAGFDSFEGHRVPHHLLNLVGVDALAGQLRPINVNSYEAGDFWLVKSDLLQIQGRFVHSKAFKPDRAAVGAVAVGGQFLDGKKLLVQAGGGITWDGQPLRRGDLLYRNLTRGKVYISSRKGTKVHGKSSSVVKAQLPLGVELHFVQFKRYLDTKITLPRRYKVDGECGNFNGVSTDDAEEAVSRRLGGLKVAAGDLIF